jgi:hypothetical protein
MPTFNWPADPGPEIQAFAQRHSNAEAGLLLIWATSCIDALPYLDEIDLAFDRTRKVSGSHRPDIVDLAHARWATGTCITALDLCVAAIGRALLKHPGPTELDLGDFTPSTRNAKPVDRRRSATPPSALAWIDAILNDPEFPKLNDARHALTHRRLPVQLTLTFGEGPGKRLDLEVLGQQVPLRQLVEQARDFASSQVPAFIALLPTL